MQKLFLLLLLSVSIVVCKKEVIEEQTFIIADHKVSCSGEGTSECLLMKQKVGDDWTVFYGGIEGFKFEAGFEYVIEVKVFAIPEPPADGSSKRYVLKRIISKQ